MKYLLFFSIIIISILFIVKSSKADTWIGTQSSSQLVNWYSIPQISGLNVNWQTVGGIVGNSSNWTDVKAYGSKFGGDHSGINWQSFGV